MKAPGKQITITDPDLLRRLKTEARLSGVASADRLWWVDTVTKCCREHYGLDADLTVIEAAQRLNVHRNTIKNYFRQGRFPHAYYRSNGLRAIRIPLADVLALRDRTILIQERRAA